MLGFATLWTMLATLPLMITAQFISAKIGLVGGRGLAGVIREQYPRWLLYPVMVCLLFANTVNAGADLLAIAAAINLLVPVSTLALVAPIAVLLLAFQIWGSYYGLCVSISVARGTSSKLLVSSNDSECCLRYFSASTCRS